MTPVVGCRPPHKSSIHKATRAEATPLPKLRSLYKSSRPCCFSYTLKREDVSPGRTPGRSRPPAAHASMLPTSRGGPRGGAGGGRKARPEVVVIATVVALLCAFLAHACMQADHAHACVRAPQLHMPRYTAVWHMHEAHPSHSRHGRTSGVRRASHAAASQQRLAASRCRTATHTHTHTNCARLTRLSLADIEVVLCTGRGPAHSHTHTSTQRTRRNTPPDR